MSNDCPDKDIKKSEPKKWTGKEAGVQIQSLVKGLSEEEKKKLQDELENEGMGF